MVSYYKVDPKFARQQLELMLLRGQIILQPDPEKPGRMVVVPGTCPIPGQPRRRRTGGG